MSLNSVVNRSKANHSRPAQAKKNRIEQRNERFPLTVSQIDKFSYSLK